MGTTLECMPTQTQSAFQTALFAVTTDPSTSNALRQRLELDIRRDPLDALADAEMLLSLAKMRVDEVLETHTPALSPDSNGTEN